MMSNLTRLGCAVFTGAALTVGAAQAGVLYNNGPCNCQSQALPIYSNSYYVGDSFTISSSATANGVEFVAWNSPSTDTTASVDWSISSGAETANGALGPLIATGTSTVSNSFLLDNLDGYGVYSDTFAIPSTALAAGAYTLILANGVSSPSGDIVRWDVNYGPSTAYNYAGFAPGLVPSESFEILGDVAGGIPEPATWALMLIGLGCLGVVLRRSHRREAFAKT